MTDHIIEAPERPGHMDKETILITQALSQLGKTWAFMPKKRLLNRTVQLDPQIPASGSIPFVKAAFACAGLPAPQDHSYPPELRKYLHRAIQETTLKRALLENRQIFIKPSKRTKKFAGFVYSGAIPNDLMGVSKFEPVWISDIIDIQSEWRTYCANKQPLHTAWCDGDKNKIPDQTIISQICSTLSDDAPYSGGCVIDTAVTTDGQTVLLELNDGYSIGAYDNVPAISYYSMIKNRWLSANKTEVGEQT